MKYVKTIWGYTWKITAGLVLAVTLVFTGFIEGNETGYIAGCALFASEGACINARLVARERATLAARQSLPTTNDSLSAIPVTDERINTLCEDLRREPGGAAAHLARFVKCG